MVDEQTWAGSFPVFEIGISTLAQRDGLKTVSYFRNGSKKSTMIKNQIIKSF